MAKQKILWTVLPYGYVPGGEFAGSLRMSIVISPRLTPELPVEVHLDSFPDFLDWPLTLSGVQFSLEVDGIGGTPLPLTRLSAAPDSNFWKSVFPKRTAVSGFQFTDMSTVNFRSYSVRNIMRFVRDNYTKLATQSPERYPTLLPYDPNRNALGDVLTALGTLPFHGEREQGERGQGVTQFFGDEGKKKFGSFDRYFFDREGDQHLNIVVPDASTSVPSTGPVRATPPDFLDLPVSQQAAFGTPQLYDFYQANRFYSRPENQHPPSRRPDPTKVSPPLKQPEFDFHKNVAALADSPQLLRRLGLLFDVALPRENALSVKLKSIATVTGTLRVHLDNAPGVDNERPHTAFGLSKTRFWTAQRTNEIANGLLQLHGTGDRFDNSKVDFDVCQVDADGAAMKMINFAASAHGLITKQEHPQQSLTTYTTGDEHGTAALRSGGLAVSQHGRALRTARLAHANALKNGVLSTPIDDSKKDDTNRVVLFAEDVLRGYRVDVFSVSKSKWFSLCERTGQYRVIKTGETGVFTPDEGYVKGASTTSKENSKDHYLHETLFRWTGWSLCTPRPGRTVVAETKPGELTQSERVDDVTEEATSGTGIITTYSVKSHSLPSLRFGVPYRFRARTVDLAGNSLLLDDPGISPDEQATNAVTYLRFEPIDPPVLVLKAKLSEGESVERMVIRSNYDQAPEQYLGTKPIKDIAAKQTWFEYTPENYRHVVTPKISQQMAEAHGFFDSAIGSTDHSIINKLFQIASRENGTLNDQIAGSHVELVTPPNLRGVTTTKLPLEPPSPTNPTGDRLVGGQYIIHREDKLTTPYLPDGIAGGAALRHVPGMSKEGTLGPGARIVRNLAEELVLLVDYAGVWPDMSGFLLRVAERPAKLDSSTCSVQFNDDGSPQWDADKRVLTVFLAKGQIAHLKYSSFLSKRYVDHMGIAGWITNDQSRRFAIEFGLVGSHWMLTPFRDLTLTHATQQPVCEPIFRALIPQRNVGNTFADLNGRIQLHGPSTGKFEIVGEWEEWVDDPAKPAPEVLHGKAQLHEVNLPENFANLFSTGDVVRPEGNVRGNRHEFGDTKFRLVRYHINATTRFREYFPTEITADEKLITRQGNDFLDVPPVKLGTPDDAGAAVLQDPTGAPLGVIIPSSARPAAPQVQYVVPTFRWLRDFAPGKDYISSTRYGNGLRVYLDRPWFSSGNGELLGVLLDSLDASVGALTDSRKAYVSQWGLDPIFDSPLPKTRMRPDAFPLRVSSEAVKLEESGQAAVVGHRVQWDDVRKLWYCDIEIDAGNAYFPFVRLALVRYQPNSLLDAKVSRVVLTDFAQLAPRRTVSLKRENPNTYRVSVFGTMPERGSMFPDSPFIGFSPVPTPFNPGEQGWNRIEVAVQQQGGSIKSDLTWTDAPNVQVLSATVNPPGDPHSVLPPVMTPAGGGGTLFSSVLAHVGAAETAIIDASAAMSGLAGFGHILERPLWEGTLTIPVGITGDLRFAVREFERYYSDGSQPSKFGNKDAQKRLVEERVVYAEFLPIPM